MNRLDAAGVMLPEVRALSRPALDELAGHRREALTLPIVCEGARTDTLAELLQADPNRRAMWEDQVAACQRALAEFATATLVAAGHRMTVPDRYLAEPRWLLAQLGELRQRFAAGKSVNKLFQGTLAELAAACRIYGEILRITGDVDIVVAYVNCLRLRQELATRWSAWRKQLNLPQEPDEQAELRAARGWV
ncbi:hypothetical protein AB0C04_26705 [Micromonospora sp. NPDC048909]|uniref:hypothetical protein n=1 Tax=Micromonospora sp. NPDC048909 TaxID=3155643 RepID=UPI0033D70145